MSVFQKPTSLKSALKLALYGQAGSGKTFTALLLSEGLARHAGRRVAVLDTEQGTAFYSQAVPNRKAHPQAFDFDVLHTRSVTETLDALHGLDPAVPVPPSDLLVYRRRRPTPYVMSDSDITRLLSAASQRPRPLTATTYHTLFGLMAVTVGAAAVT